MCVCGVEGQRLVLQRVRKVDVEQLNLQTVLNKH